MATKKPLCLYGGTIKELQSGDVLPSKREITYSISGNLSVATGTMRRYIQGKGLVVANIVASVGIAPIGSPIVFNVYSNNGITSSMLASGSIVSGSHTSTNTVVADYLVEIDSYLTADITAVGSSTAGADLTITLYE